MAVQVFHKGNRVCLTRDYLDETYSFRAGDEGTVNNYDAFLVVVSMSNYRNYRIAVLPDLIEPVNSKVKHKIREYC